MINVQNYSQIHLPISEGEGEIHTGYLWFNNYFKHCTTYGVILSRSETKAGHTLPVMTRRRVS